MKSVQTSYTQEVLCHDFVSQVHRIILHMNGKILISVVNSDHQTCVESMSSEWQNAWQIPNEYASFTRLRSSRLFSSTSPWRHYKRRQSSCAGWCQWHGRISTEMDGSTGRETRRRLGWHAGGRTRACSFPNPARVPHRHCIWLFWSLVTSKHLCCSSRSACGATPPRETWSHGHPRKRTGFAWPYRATTAKDWCCMPWCCDVIHYILTASSNENSNEC